MDFAEIFEIHPKLVLNSNLTERISDYEKRR